MKDGALSDSSSGRSPRALIWYGIVDVGDRGGESISEFGMQLLRSAVERSPEISQLVWLLTEVEHHGFKFSAERGAPPSKDDLLSSFLTDGEKTTLRKAFRLHQAGEALDALRMLFPLIEAALNAALHSLSVPGYGQLGMRAKIDQPTRRRAALSFVSTK